MAKCESFWWCWRFFLHWFCEFNIYLTWLEAQVDVRLFLCVRTMRLLITVPYRGGLSVCERGLKVMITDWAQLLAGRPSLVFTAWQHPNTFTCPCRAHHPPLPPPSSFTSPLLNHHHQTLTHACYYTWIMQRAFSSLPTCHGMFYSH